MSFDQFGLSAEILRAVSEKGYTQPTPVQEQAIPAILGGRDIMAGAQTGTGKTAGFTLPILHRLGASAAPGKGPVRCLILVPTRELADQVSQSIKAYGRHTGLKTTEVYGGVKFGPQSKALKDGADILVATPGRLLDHAEQGTVDLSQVEIFVLDEADRMLDMGFIRDIRRIMALLPKKTQNLLFSATFPREMRDFARSLLDQPAVVQVSPENTTAEQVEHYIHPVDHSMKRDLLIHLMKTNGWNQVLVFVGMKHTASRLAERLSKAGIDADSIHGDKTQSQRLKALEDFKQGRLDVLVATDLAARGLDIQQLPLVVNYELPNQAENYIHRIGRTGRAGNTGKAVSFVATDESILLKDIERLLGLKIEQTIVPGFEPDPRITHKLPSRGGNTGGFAARRPPAGANRGKRPGPRRGRNRSKAPA